MQVRRIHGRLALHCMLTMPAMHCHGTLPGSCTSFFDLRMHLKECSNQAPAWLWDCPDRLLCCAHYSQASTSIDTMVQQALNQVRAALSQRSNPNVWFRGAMFSTDAAAATLFDDMAQPGILSQAPKRAHKRERSGNAKVSNASGRTVLAARLQRGMMVAACVQTGCMCAIVGNQSSSTFL